MNPKSIDQYLLEVRAGLNRVEPAEAALMAERGALLVDIRPSELRSRDGEVPAAVVIDRNQLQWRLDPQSAHRIPQVDSSDDPYSRLIILFCDEGYASSLAADDLQRLGLARATDVEGGFQAWRAAGLPVRPVRPPG